MRYAVNFWDKMANNEDETDALFEPLSTHPASEKRSKELGELMPQVIIF